MKGNAETAITEVVKFVRSGRDSMRRHLKEIARKGAGQLRLDA